jgi:hypothetical protein
MVSLTSRGHFAILLVLLVVLDQYLAGRIRWRRAWILFGAFVLLFGAMSMFRLGYFFREAEGRQVLLVALRAFPQRFGQATQQLQALLETFPFTRDHLYAGSYWMNLVALQPGPDLGFNGWLYTVISPQAPLGLAVTPTIVGQWYVELGWLGVALGPLVLGIALQGLYIAFVRAPKRISSLVAFVVASTYLAKAAMNGLPTILFEPLLTAAAWYLLITALYWAFTQVLRPVPGRDETQGAAAPC